MLQQELLKKVVDVLDRAGIDYVLTGSVLSSFQGEPRSTHDIDILIVELRNENIQELLRTFAAPDFFLDEVSIHQAVQQHGMFNMIDMHDGNKVDFWFIADDEFDRSRFARRYKETIDGRSIVLLRPEDTILTKLRWAQLSGGSEKQMQDVLRVYEVQYKNLDIKYIADWTKKMNLEKEWLWIISKAQIS